MYAGKKEQLNAEHALRVGNFELAERLFRERLAKDPHDKGAILGLSLTLLKRKKYRDAFDQAANVLATDPSSARAHALIGSAVLLSGDFRVSAAQFQTALALKRDEALAIAGLAMIDFYEGRISASLSGLRQATYIDPNEPDYMFNLAQAATRGESYKEAANAYERFLIIAPNTDSDRRARIRGLIDFLRYLGKQKTLYLVSDHASTVVPFDLSSRRPILQVRVNGSKDTLRFVLDSGSGMCVVSEETARRLHLRQVARGGLARAVGGGGRFQIVYGFLSSLQIGEVRIQSVPVYIRRFFNDREQVDGYIGLSAINKFLATVDYGDHTVSLKRQDQEDTAAAKGSVEIPVRTTSGGFLSGEVRLDGISSPLNFIIDTGASISVVSQTLAASAELKQYDEGQRMRVYGAAGIAEDVRTLVLPHLALGPCSREKIFVAILDLEPINETAGYSQSGIVGEDFLRNYRVTFDFRRTMVLLEPVVPKPIERRSAVNLGESSPPTL